tara:strand:+ start:1162 stop:1632 length:471 start_codon:yes stop_codon:yes gene_type:complete
MIFALQFILGYIYGHFLEWFIHKDILHKYGKKKKHPFSFHYRSHHRAAKKNGFIDEAYLSSIFSWDAATKEVASLLFLIAIHIPVYFVAPGLFAACVFSVAEYYYKHIRAHRNPEWAKRNLVWHYDHHMGKIQDANWGVRSDFVDRLLGTRIYYTK